MRIGLDAKVRTSDGHDAGRVKRVLIDPATRHISGFVIGSGGPLGSQVIVGEEDFAETAAHGELTLRLDKAALDRQPSFKERGFTAPPAELAVLMGYGYPSNAYLVPIVANDAPVTESPRPTLKKGDVVKDRDGDVVGVVEEVRFDAATGQLTGFAVKAGAGIERLIGGGETAEISSGDILRIVDGEVRLGVDREEIVPSPSDSGAFRR